MRHCALKERGGLQIADIKGPLSMDSLKLKMPQLLLKTPDSWLKAAVDMDLNAFSDSCPGRLSLRANASLGKRDLMRFMSGMPAPFRRQWPDKPLTVNTILSGNLQRMRLRLLNLNLPSALKADANGYLTNLTDTKRLGASINFKASAANTQLITALVGKENMGGARIPNGISLSGNVKTGGNQVYLADVTMREGGGTMKAKARFSMPDMAYSAKVSAAGMRIDHFMPTLGMKDFSGTLDVNGMGTDPMKKSMTVDASADIRKFVYDKYHFTGITADARLSNGLIHANINSKNQLLDGLLSVDGFVSSKKSTPP